MWPWPPLFVWWWWDVMCMAGKGWDGGGSPNDDVIVMCHHLSFALVCGVGNSGWLGFS